MMTFDQWFGKHCQGINSEGKRLMRMAWNAAVEECKK